MPSGVPDLVTLFDNLQTPNVLSQANYAEFVAVKLPDLEKYHLAKDAGAKPVFLIEVDEIPSDSKSLSIELEHLQVQNNVNCSISYVDGKVVRGRFIIVCCISSNRNLQTYFLQAVGAIITFLGPNPTTLQVQIAISNLVELFRVFSEPPQKSIQGLWAELLLIAQAQDADTLIDAWHSSPDDLYDFSQGVQRIEVKSASGKIRQHHFSLQQLSPPRGIMLLVASIMVERMTMGSSILSLMHEVRTKVKYRPELMLKVDSVVAATLGNSWRRAGDEYFNRELAVKSLCFFDGSEIPCVDRNLPNEISAVHFQVDLSKCNLASLEYVQKSKGLFGAAVSTNK